MNHSLYLVFLCGLVASCAGNVVAGPVRPMLEEPNRRPASQETTISAEDILRRALDARGRETAAARIQSFRCQGTADIVGAIRCNYEYIATRFNQARETLDVRAGGRYEFAFDGQTAWEVRPESALEVQSGEKLRESSDGAAFFAWYDDPRSFRSATYAGEASFGGLKCYVLKLTTSSGREETHYYNESNYLLAGILERVTTDTGPAWLRTSFRPSYGGVGGPFGPRLVRRQGQPRPHRTGGALETKRPVKPHDLSAHRAAPCNAGSPVTLITRKTANALG
jgi:hypothetical protein